jgi:hypothetical protein
VWRNRCTGRVRHPKLQQNRSLLTQMPAEGPSVERTDHHRRSSALIRQVRLVYKIRLQDIDTPRRKKSSASLKDVLRNSFGRDEVAVRREEKINRISSRIERAVQIGPLSRHWNIRLIHVPRWVRSPQLRADSLVELAYWSHPNKPNRIGLRHYRKKVATFMWRCSGHGSQLLFAGKICHIGLLLS